MNRTPDLLITNELLYRLSYTGLNPNYNLESPISLLKTQCKRDVDGAAQPCSDAPRNQKKCATDVPGICRANSLRQFKLQLKSCGAPGWLTDFRRGAFVIKTQAVLPSNFRMKSRKQ